MRTPVQKTSTGDMWGIFCSVIMICVDFLQWENIFKPLGKCVAFPQWNLWVFYYCAFNLSICIFQNDSNALEQNIKPKRSFYAARDLYKYRHQYPVRCLWHPFPLSVCFSKCLLCVTIELNRKGHHCLFAKIIISAFWIVITCTLTPLGLFKQEKSDVGFPTSNSRQESVNGSQWSRLTHLRGGHGPNCRRVLCHGRN